MMAGNARLERISSHLSLLRKRKYTGFSANFSARRFTPRGAGYFFFFSNLFRGLSLVEDASKDNEVAPKTHVSVANIMS